MVSSTNSNTNTTSATAATTANAQKTFLIPRNDAGDCVEILIAEPAGLKAEGLGLTTWGASLILANQLWKLREPVGASAGHGSENDRESDGEVSEERCAMGDGAHGRLDVLELGAGTGLVGLAAARLWGAHVVMTDLEPIVPGTEASCRLNWTEREEKGRVQCGTLDWSRPSSLRLYTTTTTAADDDESTDSEGVLHAKNGKDSGQDAADFEIIVSADTLYDEDQPPLLTNTIATWLRKGREARAIVCYACRFAYMDVIRDFWSRMEALGFECVGEGQENTREGEDWMEVGGTPYEWCVWRWRDEG